MNIISEELKNSAEKNPPKVICAEGNDKEIEVVVGQNTVLSTGCTVKVRKPYHIHVRH